MTDQSSTDKIFQLVGMVVTFLTAAYLGLLLILILLGIFSNDPLDYENHENHDYFWECRTSTKSLWPVTFVGRAKDKSFCEEVKP